MNDMAQGWSPALTALHEDMAAGQHPMDVAARRDALAQLHRYFSADQALTILEVGCGSGYLLDEIAAAFPSAGIFGEDVHPTDSTIAGWSLLDCPLPTGLCDAVLALSVLEHIQDDTLALQQLYRILRPGGIAIIQVPAGQHLYDGYDAALGHYRRYADGVLAQQMLNVGFEITRETHLGAVAYPAFWAAKTWNQLTHAKPSPELVRENATSSSNGMLMRAALKLEQAPASG